MNCEFCEKEFTIVKTGRGGSNRALCYKCLPPDLDKNARRKIRSDLLVLKARNEKLEMGCSKCGYNKNPSALEWHHPLDDKLIHPSNTLKISWIRYKAETSKCVLLCANCHREEHNPFEV